MAGEGSPSFPKHRITLPAAPGLDGTWRGTLGRSWIATVDGVSGTQQGGSRRGTATELLLHTVGRLGRPTSFPQPSPDGRPCRLLTRDRGAAGRAGSCTSRHTARFEGPRHATALALLVLSRRLVGRAGDRVLVQTPSLAARGRFRCESERNRGARHHLALCAWRGDQRR